jgi:EAL domain-containing protein (putative c-di-GMP-specific phosphodiesterase class I)
LETESNGAEIVQAILTLAQSLGMKVVAEGVETDNQFARLKAMNCELVQGFLFARPVDSLAAGFLLERSARGNLIE